MTLSWSMSCMGFQRQVSFLPGRHPRWKQFSTWHERKPAGLQLLYDRIEEPWSFQNGTSVAARWGPLNNNHQTGHRCVFTWRLELLMICSWYNEIMIMSFVFINFSIHGSLIFCNKKHNNLHINKIQCYFPCQLLWLLLLISLLLLLWLL